MMFSFAEMCASSRRHDCEQRHGDKAPFIPELVYTPKFVSRPLNDAISTACVARNDRKILNSDLGVVRRQCLQGIVQSPIGGTEKYGDNKR